MDNGKGALMALHLFLVWATMTLAAPVLGFTVVGTAWGGGPGAALTVLAVGVPLAVLLLSVMGMPVRTVVPLCGSVPRRLLWAVLVFALGTLGVLAGVAAYGKEVGLGDGGTRIALTGVPYAVAAAFFVPGRWVRLGALAVLATAVAYGGFLGPAQAKQRRHEEEVAGYRERAETLLLGAAPSDMRVSRAESGPASFSAEYRPVREGYESRFANLSVRLSFTPTVLRCPERAEQGVTCSVDARGDLLTVRDHPYGGRSVSLTRQRQRTEIDVTGDEVDEAELRGILDSLHPLSDAELEALIREERIRYRI
ncbi:hypothetical protein ACFRMQ_33885 [Kitasatospora sp. NPDC056783]|uniref:hypothetical protein n=1 Tax=Kitasatospora sp. NPDC056783 TaxID=3345943 RepID=UPI0036BD26D9